MAVRRVRPPQPLAPHGLPGHLVGFVEALRAQGISVGPSETVDAGRVLTVLGLGDREALREGLADRRRLDGYERRVDDVRAAAAMRAEDELVDRESL